MKRLLHLLPAALLLAGTAKSQIYTNVTGLHVVPSVVRGDVLNNVYAGGNFSDSLDIDGSVFATNGGTDIWLAKYNSTAAVQWKAYGGGTGNDGVSAMTVDNSGNLYALLYFTGTMVWNNTPYTSAGGTDLLMVKYDAYGAQLWATQVGSATDDMGFFAGLDGNVEPHIITTTTSYTYTAGGTTYTAGLGSNILHIRFTAGGIVNATQTIATNNGGLFAIQPNAAQVDASGNVYFSTFASTGTLNVGDSTYNPTYATGHFLSKVDASGHLVWHKQFNYNGGPNEAIALDAAGNITYTGDWDTQADFGDTTFSQPGVASDDIFVLHYNNNGGYQWGQSWGSTAGDENAQFCKINAQGEIVVCGYVGGPTNIGSYTITSNSTHDFYVAVLNSNGQVLRAFSSNIGNTDLPLSMDAAPTGHNIYISGAAVIGNTLANYTFAGVNYNFITTIDDDACQATGRVYKDYNSNAAIDGTDAGLGDVMVQATPGNYYSISGQAGGYQELTMPGTYVLSVPNPPLYYTLTTPATQTTSMAALGDVDSVHNFGFYPTPGIRDLRIYVSNINQPVPGYLTAYNVIYKNTGTDTAASGTVSVTFPGVYTYAASTPAYDANAGSTISWNFANLLPGETRSIQVFMDVSTSANPGDAETVNGSVTSTGNTEITPADNTMDAVATVVSSFDPNTKEAIPSAVAPAYVTDANWFTYNIRFQNTGTSMAHNIRILDTLDANLDLGTFEMIGATHAVATKVNNTRILQFDLENINLPDSTTDQAGSHGEVSFRIKANTNMATPGVIYNTGAIYFDYNPAVMTNKSVITVGTLGVNNLAASGTSMVLFPNPAGNKVNVSISQPNTTGALQLSLTDASGKTVYSHTVQANNVAELTLPALAPGLYIARLNQNGKLVSASKLTISK